VAVAEVGQVGRRQEAKALVVLQVNCQVRESGGYKGPMVKVWVRSPLLLGIAHLVWPVVVKQKEFPKVQEPMAV